MQVHKGMYFEVQSIHTLTHTNIDTHIHIHVYIHTYTYMYTFIHTHTHFVLQSTFPTYLHIAEWL